MVDLPIPDTWLPLSHGELVQVLLMHFGAASEVQPGKVAFPEKGERQAVELAFRDGTIDATRGPAFNKQDWDRLIARVADVLTAGTPGVGRAIAFRRSPVLGAWTPPSKHLQVLPPPVEAPRPPAQWGDHPFIIEFEMSLSADPIINSLRRQEVAQRAINFLNVVLTGRTWVLLSSSYQTWGTSLQSGDPRSEWFQYPFYNIPGFQTFGGGFSVEAYSQLPKVPYVDYYAGLGFDHSIPDIADLAVERYYSLTRESRIRFDRAAYWLSLARQIWQISASLTFQALVTSIEVACSTSMQERCSCCDRCQAFIGSGSTADFKQFLRSYSLTKPRAAAELYRLRSKLTHGARIFVQDSSFSLAMDQKSQAERRQFTSLSMVAQIALLNWLLDGCP